MPAELLDVVSDLAALGSQGIAAILALRIGLARWRVHTFRTMALAIDDPIGRCAGERIAELMKGKCWYGSRSDVWLCVASVVMLLVAVIAKSAIMQSLIA
jgi:hypothetical protein